MSCSEVEGGNSCERLPEPTHIASDATCATGVGAVLLRRSCQHVAFRSGSELERACSEGHHSSAATSGAVAGEAPGAGRASPRTRDIAFEREDSIMGEVQDRIVRLQILSGTSQTGGAPTPASSSRGMPNMKSPWPSSADSTPARWALPQADEAWPLRSGCGLPHVRFGPAVIGSVTLVVLLACLSMFVAMEQFTRGLQRQTLERYQRSIAAQSSLTERLTADAAQWSYSSILRSISTMVQLSVMLPPDRALETLWGTMRTNRMLDPSWNGTSATQRWGLSRRALVELLDQYSNRTGIQTGFLFVAFKGGEFAGASVLEVSPGGPVGQAVWYDCTKSNATLNMTGVDISDDSFRAIPGQAGQIQGFDATQRPWFKVQERRVEAKLPAAREWSKVYSFVRPQVLGLTRTLPLAHCGHYGCLEGVLGADITLSVVSNGCRNSWLDFQSLLGGSTYEFPLNPENSGVFVVNHVTIYPEQEGLLLGASDPRALDAKDLTFADRSPHGIVQRTAQAVLKRFVSWSAPALKEQQHILFSYLRPELGDCDPQDVDCMQVSMLSVQIDGQQEGMRWLVVLVSPAAAFHALAARTRREVHLEVLAMESQIELSVEEVRLRGFFVFVFAALVSLFVGLCLGLAVSGPLRRLSGMMGKLGELDFAYVIGECTKLRAGCRTQIREVSDLQDAFCRLSRAIEAFARFVPEAVVRSIISGDERATRLHVSRRTVSIMFSDIRDFTAISETLRDRDLIFLLTRYLSVMTRLAEDFEGVVAEILGDGLLAFWNTPTDVEEHAEKACLAALAMQQALVRLNVEMQMLGLPVIAVRIGLHTGIVLSGNIGSDMKMKFGCMGDAVNLASRLEGLCKVYGIGTVCSSATYEALRPDHELICRKLDLVQVKGRRDPVLLYEVMGTDPLCSAEETEEGSHELYGQASPARSSTSRAASLTSSGCLHVQVGKSPEEAARQALECSAQSLRTCEVVDFDALRKLRRLERRRGEEAALSPSTPGSCAADAACPGAAAVRLREHAALYERALALYQAAQFREARDAALLVMQEHPSDKAAGRLLQMAGRHLDGDKVVGFSDEDLSTWRGISVMTEK